MTDLPLLISTLEEGDHGLVELRVETRAEVWRDVPGLPFRASNFGRIIGKRGVVLGGSLCRDGYRWTVAEIDRKRRVLSFHSLVAAAFHGPRPPGHDIDHIDGDRTNNAPHNVRYCPHAENMARLRKPDSKRAQRRQGKLRLVAKVTPKVRGPRKPYIKKGPARLTGDKNGRAKITEAQAREILALPRSRKHGDPNSPKQIAARYGIGRITLYDLLTGKTWTHLHGPSGVPATEPKTSQVSHSLHQGETHDA